ncbi:hypothetical protein C8R42DRAFT_442827 [Lentinula raphanica]|nr:hypothetical protein C8R42DRAFT_442827 [Lentinula raphanica]
MEQLHICFCSRCGGHRPPEAIEDARIEKRPRLASPPVSSTNTPEPEGSTLRAPSRQSPLRSPPVAFLKSMVTAMRIIKRRLTKRVMRKVVRRAMRKVVGRATRKVVERATRKATKTATRMNSRN